VIVLSAGMQKSGTGWFFNLTNGLVAASGGDDTRELRTTSRRLGEVIQPHNCAIGPPTARKLAVLLGPHLRGRRFTVKTHGRPGTAVRALMTARALQATYQYRDLRDVVVSVLDHGSKVKDFRPGDRMVAVKTVDDACRYVAELFPVWQAWTAIPGVFTVSYEALRAEPAAELRRLVDHLGLTVDEAAIAGVLERHPPGDGSADWESDGLHFNKGQVGRFAEVLSRDDLDRCNVVLGDQLVAMGYELV
jgi:Sulfotransferase domain